MRADSLRHGTWPARRLWSSCTARAMRHASASSLLPPLGSTNTTLPQSGAHVSLSALRDPRSSQQCENAPAPPDQLHREANTMILLPKSWSFPGAKAVVGCIALVVLLFGTYLAFTHGCDLGRRVRGGATYSSYTLVFLSFPVLVLLVGSSARLSRVARILVFITLPLTLYYVPILIVGIASERGERACASP